MRHRRILEARHQTRTRAFNEWIECANESVGLHAGTDPFRCECGDSSCVYPIALTRAEYESVRAYPTRFAIARNHENPESACVLSENARFGVIDVVAGDARYQVLTRNPRHAWVDGTAQDAISQPSLEQEGSN